MTDIAQHATLQAVIASAHDTYDAAWQALRDTTEDSEDFAARLIDWRAASARHAALIEAGIILTLGIGDDHIEIPG